MMMKKLKNNIYWQYSMLFLALFLVIALPLIIKKGLFIDGLTQHIVFFQDYIGAIKQFILGNELNIYRPDLGLGSDIFTYYTFYSLFDPLNIIAVLLPISWIHFEYILFIAIRLYFAGIFFIWLLKYTQVKSTRAILLSALFYVFNVTVLYSAFRHPMFINGVLWLPLIFLGASKCLDGKKAYWLVVGAFFAFITQFYLSIYSAIAFEAFVIIKLWLARKEEPWEKRRNKWLLVNYLFGLGILIGGFVLVPQLLAVYFGSRAQTKGLLIYDNLYYLGTISSFFIPMISSSYTSSIGNGLVFLFALVYFFQHKRDWKTIFFTIFSLMLFISLFGFAVNVFSYVNNRWSYILILPVALAVGTLFDEQETIDALHLKNPVKLIVGLGLSMVLFFGGFILSNRFSGIGKVIVQVVAGMLVLLLLYTIKKSPEEKWNWVKSISIKAFHKWLLVSYVVFGLAVSLLYTFSMTTNTNLAAYDHKEAYDMFVDDTYYRMDQSSYVLRSDYLGNDNLVYGYKSTYAYNSMASSSIGQVMDYYNVYNLNSTVGYTGFNNRTALNAINQVKFMLIKASDARAIPFGFLFVDRFPINKVENPTIANGGVITDELEHMSVYESNHFLPFGFVYHQYVSKQFVDGLNEVERENLLLTHGLLDDDQLPAISYDQINKVAPTLSLTNAHFQENELIASEDAIIQFTIPYVFGHDVYFHAQNIRNLENKKVNYYVEAYQNNELLSRYRETLYAQGTFFYHDNFEPLINLGAFPSGDLTVKIRFDKGVYAISDIGYYVNDVTDVATKTSLLAQETLEDITFHSQGFSGTIDLNSDGLLFISLPYSQGFTAFVDGVKTEIEQVNIGYMGLFLEAGHHNIEFVYEVVGMKVGLLVSMLGLSLLVVTLVCERACARKKREKK